MEKEGLLSYWHHVSWRRYQELIAYFGSLEHAWHADERDIKKLKWKSEWISEFIKLRSSLDEHAVEQHLRKLAVACVGYNNPLYPKSLKHIPDPPIALFVRGNLPVPRARLPVGRTGPHMVPENLSALDRTQRVLPYLAVVGTRRCTSYGERVTKNLVKELVPYNICIVSGLAFGIDAVAHRSCLEARGRTIAVLGGAIDNVSPQEHRSLTEKIIEHGGTVVSEHPPGYTVNKQSFVTRNRIIAGLSDATLVTEAPVKSGALITAECSLEYGKDVFAVPHSLHNFMGKGCNELIRQGAYIALDAGQIAEHMGLQILENYDRNSAASTFSDVERSIIDAVSKQQMHVDQLSKRVQIPTAELLGILMKLEIDGIIQKVDGMEYVIT